MGAAGCAGKAACKEGAAWPGQRARLAAQPEWRRATPFSEASAHPTEQTGAFQYLRYIKANDQPLTFSLCLRRDTQGS